MGLFDNLFLDANTPVTINDGVDHSKEFGSANPSGTGGQSGGSSSGGNPGDQKDPASQKKDPTKKDDGLQGLFDTDKKEEKDAQEALHPEPARDIALEIGLSVPAEDPTTPNIDIGGDISFDIGGDMIGDLSPTSSSQTPSGSGQSPVQIESIGVDASLESQTLNVPLEGQIGTNVVPPLGGESSDTKDISSQEGSGLPSPDLPMAINAPGKTDTPVLNTESPDTSALFSLLNGPDEIKKVDNTSASPLSDTTLGISQIDSEAIISDTTSASDIFGFSTSENPVAVIPEDQKSENTVVSTLSEGIVKTMTSSPKLKSRISQLLGQLEAMDFSDQSQKEYKEKQIEMYRIRIADLKAEYDMRIRALQLEIDALEGEMRKLESEVADMENEKTRIKSVIENFQKELETTA